MCGARIRYKEKTAKNNVNSKNYVQGKQCKINTSMKILSVSRKKGVSANSPLTRNTNVTPYKHVLSKVLLKMYCPKT